MHVQLPCIKTQVIAQRTMHKVHAQASLQNSTAEEFETAEHTWLNIIAEILLGTHAFGDQRRIEPDVIGTFHLLAKQLA